MLIVRQRKSTIRFRKKNSLILRNNWANLRWYIKTINRNWKSKNYQLKYLKLTKI